MSYSFTSAKLFWSKKSEVTQFKETGYPTYWLQDIKEICGHSLKPWQLLLQVDILSTRTTYIDLMSVEVQLFPSASCLLSLAPYTKVPTEANLTIPCLLILHLNKCLGINLHIHRNSEAAKRNPVSISLDFRWWKSILLQWCMLCVCVCVCVCDCVYTDATILVIFSEEISVRTFLTCILAFTNSGLSGDG